MTPSLPPSSLEQSPGDATDPAHRVFQVALVMLVLGLVSNAFSAFFGIRAQVWRSIPGLAASGLWLIYTLVCALSAWLSRRGRVRLAAWLVLGGLIVSIPLATLFISRLGLVTGAGLIGMITVMAAAMGLPPAEVRRATLISAAMGVLTALLDLFGPASRLTPPVILSALVPLIMAGVMGVYAYFLLREFKAFTLRSKLIVAFLAVTLIPLSVLALLNDRLTSALLLRTTQRSLSAAAAETANRMDDFVNTNLDAVSTAAQFPALGEYLLLPEAERDAGTIQSQVIKYLSSLKNRRSGSTTGAATYLLSYALLDREGLVALDIAAKNLGEDVSARDYFARPFREGAPFASPVQFEPGAGAVVYFSAQVLGPNLQPVGVLTARYDAAILQQLVAQSNDLIGERSSAILVDEHHLRLGDGESPELIFKSVMPLSLERIAELQAARRLPLRPIEELSTSLPDLEQALSQTGSRLYFMGKFHADDDLEQAAVASLKTQPWWVVFEQTRSALLAPIEAQTRLTILLALVMAIVVMGAAVGAARVLSNPITRLTAIARQIASGNLNVRARIESDDEIGALASAFNSMTNRLQQALMNLEQSVAERTSQLQAAAEIGRATTSVRDLDELLRLALQLIRERFGFYHASIFLMDKTSSFAVLRESTGEAGAQLKASGHKLAVGSRSLIGWVTANRYPRAALDAEEDPFHFKDPLLPNTRSELAIPLAVGGRLLGVLDVQSTTPNAFHASDVQVLQTLADLLSVAIENAELFQRTQASLEEARMRYRHAMTGTGLHTLLSDHPRETVYELRPGAAEPAAGAASRPIEIPLRVRGEVIGTLELHGRAPDELSLEEQAVLEATASQMSVALESAVLFEETQRRSRREQLINRIADQMRTSLNPETIMRNGIRELGKALRATQVVVQLHSPGSAQPDEKEAPGS